MSILDRLQLLVRSQVGSPAQESGSAPVSYPGAMPLPVTAPPDARAVESLEQKALQADAAGDTSAARRFASTAADLEYQLSGGRFGAPDTGTNPASVSVTGPARVQIPQNPYGVANPPMASAPALRPAVGNSAAAPARPDWFAAGTAEQRFDRYTGGSTGGSIGGATDDALRSLRTIFNPENP
jgi:hypothetical protein